MVEQPTFEPEKWIRRIQVRELPVLRHTKQQLDDLQEWIDDVTARDIVRIVMQDPLLSVRMIAHTQKVQKQSLHHDISTISSSIMMMGINPFIRSMGDLKSVEDIMQDVHPQGLLWVLQLINSARTAARYANEWALWRVDVNIREIRLAALLHDLAEILLYILEPQLALKIRAIQQHRPDVESEVAQRVVLGCTFADIQMMFCHAWNLPSLLSQLIDDRNAGNARVKNVMLAVKFARHLADGGWSNPAVSGDLTEIAHLLNVDLETLETRLNLTPEAHGSAHLRVEEGDDILQ